MEFYVVEAQDKPGFLCHHFKDPLFDQKVFKAAEQFLKGYSGGYWEYVQSDNDAPFLRIKGRTEAVLIHPVTDENFLIDNNLAGLIVTYCAVSGMPGFGKTLFLIKEAIANYCIETDRGDVLQALVDY